MEIVKRGEWFAHCPTCDQPMEQVRPHKRSPYVFHCSSCDPPLPTLEERMELALLPQPASGAVRPGKVHRLVDGRQGVVLATLYEPEPSVWIDIEGVQQKLLRNLIEGVV